jgi:hypothetical protein
MAHGLRPAVLNRVFGFEIMPVSLVIAHMELSRLLETGAPLTNPHRAGGCELAGVCVESSLMELNIDELMVKPGMFVLAPDKRYHVTGGAEGAKLAFGPARKDRFLLPLPMTFPEPKYWNEPSGCFFFVRVIVVLSS